MSMVIAGRGDVDLDLTGDLTKLKEVPFVIKEGCEYRLKITFKVQHEVVCGLKYMHAIYRKGIRCKKKPSAQRAITLCGLIFAF